MRPSLSTRPTVLDQLRVSLLLAFHLCWLISPPTEAQWETPTNAPLAIKGGWLFDGVGDQRVANTGLLIEDGRISQMRLGDTLPAGAQLITIADDETLIPGMIDLHAHYNLDLVDAGRVEEVAYNGQVFLANGVTATWSAGEFNPERVISQREKIDSGLAVGPRLFASGPYFGGFRCEYNVKVAADDCIAWPNDITESEIRAEVDRWAEQDVISIKIKQATPEEMQILLDQAHKRGMTAAAHLANYNVEYDVVLRDAILMGLDRVEHQLTLGSGGAGSAEMGEMIDLMIKHQVYYDANLQMYGGILQRQQYPDTMVWTDESRYFTPYAQALLIERGAPAPESDAPEFAQRQRELKALYDAGGEDLLIVGTDEPVYTNLLPGFAYHRELLAMTYAGLPPIAVLKAATINGARALGVDDKIGSIEAGKLADLIVVKGNPLQDIKAARDVRLVVKNGEVYDPPSLLQGAEGKIGPKNAKDHEHWTLKIPRLQRPSPH